jgi:hypothetical protein
MPISPKTIPITALLTRAGRWVATMHVVFLLLCVLFLFDGQEILIVSIQGSLAFKKQFFFVLFVG